MNVAFSCSARDCLPVNRRDCSSGVRKSPCPDVDEIIAPDGQIRGPAALPASIAAFAGKIGPPRSRTLVKPRMSIWSADVSAAFA